MIGFNSLLSDFLHSDTSYCMLFPVWSDQWYARWRNAHMQRYAGLLAEKESRSACHSEVLWAWAHLQCMGWCGNVKQFHRSIFFNLLKESILSFFSYLDILAVPECQHEGCGGLEPVASLWPEQERQIYCKDRCMCKEKDCFFQNMPLE